MHRQQPGVGPRQVPPDQHRRPPRQRGRVAPQQLVAGLRVAVAQDIVQRLVGIDVDDRAGRAVGQLDPGVEWQQVHTGLGWGG